MNRQGIDIQQTMVTTFGGDSAQGRTNNLHLQHDVNLKGLRDVNAYCLKALPVSTDVSSAHTIPSSGGGGGRSHSTGTNSPTNQINSSSTTAGAAKRLSYTDKSANSSKTTHPMVRSLHDTILSSSLTLKNVDLLIEVERLCVMLGGCRITFCKSGKDRTGMACTLDQSRQLGERYGCGMTLHRVLKDANLMRVHGCRLLIAEKNIGRKVCRFNLCRFCAILYLFSVHFFLLTTGLLDQSNASAVFACDVPSPQPSVRGSSEEGQLIN